MRAQRNVDRWLAQCLATSRGPIMKVITVALILVSGALHRPPCTHTPCPTHPVSLGKVTSLCFTLVYHWPWILGNQMEVIIMTTTNICISLPGL